MFDRLKRLFELSNLTEVGLRKAVTLAWITEEQYIEIVGEPYEPAQ